MPEIEIKVPGYQCGRCGHKWIARKKDKPIICPKCKSPYWDIPKKNIYKLSQN